MLMKNGASDGVRCFFIDIGACSRFCLFLRFEINFIGLSKRLFLLQINKYE